MKTAPENDNLRKAVRWLSDGKDYSADAINSTAARFDLSPLDTEFLLREFLGADQTPDKV